MFSHYKDRLYDIIIGVISVNDGKNAVIVITADERNPTTASPTISCDYATDSNLN